MVETDCWDPKNIKRNLVRKKGRKYNQIISEDGTATKRSITQRYKLKHHITLTTVTFLRLITNNNPFHFSKFVDDERIKFFSETSNDFI